MAQAKETEVLTRVEGVVAKVSTFPLLFEAAQPLIPVVAEIIAIASAEIAQLISGETKLDPKADVLDPKILMTLLPGMRNLASFLGQDNRLEKLAPKILPTTRVALPNREGELEWYELVKLKDRAYVFDEYPEIYLPTLFHAGAVTFARFFPVRAQRDRTTPTP